MKQFLFIIFTLSSISSFAQFNKTTYKVDIKYEPSLPTMYASMLRSRQQLYNQRSQEVNDRIASLRKDVNKAPISYEATLSIRETINKCVNLLNEENYDYSDQNTWNHANYILVVVEDVVYDEIKKAHK